MLPLSVGVHTAVFFASRIFASYAAVFSISADHCCPGVCFCQISTLHAVYPVARSDGPPPYVVQRFWAACPHVALRCEPRGSGRWAQRSCVPPGGRERKDSCAPARSRGPDVAALQDVRVLPCARRVREPRQRQLGAIHRARRVNFVGSMHANLRRHCAARRPCCTGAVPGSNAGVGNTRTDGGNGPASRLRTRSR